jgi:hypothetical protein
MRGKIKMAKKCWIVFAALALVLSACTQSGPKQQNAQTDSSHNVTQAKKLPKIDHMIIVVEENRSKKAITGNPSATYINALMKQGANFTNFHALMHPSQPNYLNLFSGSNQGVTGDGAPKMKFSAVNLGSELIRKNYTFTGYSEDLPRAGFSGETGGPYARKHNPWVNFSNVPKDANQPLTNFPKDFSKLPTVSFVIPNLNHDMHDGTIKEGDLWLKQHLDSYVQWAKNHNSLLIVTWDEDDYSEKNTIPTFFVGPMVKTGQYNDNFTHFSLLKTIEDIYGISYAGESQSASAITTIWK